ncbi:hypothetical protein LR48_Vigan01g041600 [Vigna angularis]|uniref:Uncharacterized protein n=1 Tax=Phaseolus angularis TaxID=3914 RepID=A0A0L9TK47_PHAAN|nr:hypothetical protein LR48_Vigan01g041600 [Vigna angularis]
MNSELYLKLVKPNKYYVIISYFTHFFTNRHENKKLNKKAKHDLRIVRAEGETAINKGRGEGLADIGEKVDGSVEIGGGRTVDDADDAESFAVRLKVLPGTGRRAAEDKLEAEGSGVPGLDFEGGLQISRHFLHDDKSQITNFSPSQCHVKCHVMQSADVIEDKDVVGGAAVT